MVHIWYEARTTTLVTSIGRSAEPVGVAFHLTQDLLQLLGHVVRFLRGPVVPLQVLQEAEEECVNRHVVDSEEGAGNDVTTHHNEDNRGDGVVEGGDLLLKKALSTLKKENIHNISP